MNAWFRFNDLIRSSYSFCLRDCHILHVSLQDYFFYLVSLIVPSSY